MSLAFFIARRLASATQKSFSRLILRIAVVAVALSMAVMLISTAIVAGFKTEISEKVFGFWGHIHISSSIATSSYNFEHQPMNRGQFYYPSVDTISRLYDEQGRPRSRAGLRHIQVYAHKEGIIKTKEQIEGIVLRGFSDDYDWSFLNNYIVEGEALDFASDFEQDDASILISETTAKRLRLKLGESFPIYFAQGEASQAKMFTIRGIFKTGLEEYDRRFAITDLRQVQSLNNWRPYKTYGPEIWLPDEDLRLLGLNAGTAEEYADGLLETLLEGEIPDWSARNSKAVLISKFLAQKNNWKLGDSILLKYKEEGQEDTYLYRLQVAGIFDEGEDASWRKVVVAPWLSLQGPNSFYDAQVSGFELFLDNIEDLDAYGNYLNYEMLRGYEQYANTLREAEPNIFDWLSLTDMNERIITLLMILVALINMSTALMILILERSNMIGILKALGAQNWDLRKLFLYQAAYIISLGLFWGNLIGLAFIYLQGEYQFIQLPEDMYYVAYAPVRFEWLSFLLLNLGTVALVLLVLLIPSWLVSSIEPVKAIRFK